MNKELRYLRSPTKDEIINNWKEYCDYLLEEISILKQGGRA